MSTKLKSALDGIDQGLQALDLPDDQRAVILADVRAKATARQAVAAQSARDLNTALARTVHGTRLKGNMLMGGRVMCDPKFEMLLDLFIADHEARQVSVGDLCLSADAPQTTGLRHIEKLEHEGFLRRRPDDRDGRRCWVEPTSRAIDGVTAYMNELRRCRA